LKQSENGVWNPVITEELKNAAYNIVSNEIMSQIGYDEKGTGVKVKSGGGGGLTEKQQIDKTNKENYTVDVYTGVANGFANGDFSAFNTSKYLFKRKTNSKGKPYIEAYQRDNPGESDLTTQALIDKGILKPEITTFVPKDAAYLLRIDTGSSPATPNDYNNGRDRWINVLKKERIFKYEDTGTPTPKNNPPKNPAGTVKGGNVR
jgi:hypothetical protein